MAHDGAFECSECHGIGAIHVQTDVDDDECEFCAACEGDGAQRCLGCDEGLAVVEIDGEPWCVGCVASAREAA